MAIVGVGLIGGSLARALRRGELAREIVGVGPDLPALEEARSLGVVDRFETDLRAGVTGCDLVVVATPLGAMAPVFAAIAPSLGPETVVTDVGSTKGSVVAAAREALGESLGRYVPGHPIAGTERSGVGASFAELFDDRVVVLCPLEETAAPALERVQTLWQAIGARVERLTPEAHDAALAATSHLPHLLAFALVDVLARHRDAETLFRYAAGGFRDFTRIASSQPELWADISLANDTALLEELDIYTRELAGLRQALADGDRDAIVASFARAKAARDVHFVGASRRDAGSKPG